MSDHVDDLTPFFADPCWMYVLLARQATIGVILRRGPTAWWRVTLWDTRHDTFEAGQWFRGHLYPAKCDLSPDGSLLVYFAGKYRPRDAARGYHATWIAVSRPPYLTALALWPIGDTWGGRGVFLDDRTLLIATSGPSFGARNHPDHPPGPLRVLEYCALKKGDPRHNAKNSADEGWVGIPSSGTRKFAEFRKTSGALTLGRKTPSYYFCPSRRRTLYTLYRADGDPVVLFEAHWADFDQRGRLVAAVGGRIVVGTLRGRRLMWRQVAAMHEEKPERMEAPRWAQRW